MVHLSLCPFPKGGKLLTPKVWKSYVSYIQQTKTFCLCVAPPIHKNMPKQYNTQLATHSQKSPAQIICTQQLCAFTVVCQEPQWPLTPDITPKANFRLTDHNGLLVATEPLLFSAWSRDKAVLEKYQLSLNNCSQKGHWLGVSSTLAKDITF